MDDDDAIAVETVDVPGLADGLAVEDGGGPFLRLRLAQQPALLSAIERVDDLEVFRRCRAGSF